MCKECPSRFYWEQTINSTELLTPQADAIAAERPEADVPLADAQLASMTLPKNGRSRFAPLVVERKQSTMIVLALLAYVLCAFAFTPRMLELFQEAKDLAGGITIALFILQTHIFWLYGAFFALQAIFSWIERPRRSSELPRINGGPRVAILYTTLHDFQEKAVLSCINQRYGDCHTFILDDSSDEGAKAVVDDFARRHQSAVTVVRRGDRVGYKAGNINNALKHHVKGFEYFAIADADSIFPPHFVSELLPHFCNDPKIGFVQGGFEPDRHPHSSFARDLGLQIMSMWKVFAPARNRYGSVIFLGHGGIIRYNVWAEIGGFPPLISEDLAFSHRARRKGYRGRFVPHVTSYEEFPVTYRAFRKQQKRYVQGICQYIHYDLWAYLKSRQVPWFEKVDTLLTCGGLLMPVFFLSFIVLYCIVMPFMFGVRNLFALQLGDAEVLFPIYLLSERFSGLGLAADYFVVTAFCTLAPSVGGLWLMQRHPLKGARTIWLAAAPYMSLLVMSSVATISYALFRTAKFTATGERGVYAKDQTARQTKSWLPAQFNEDNVAMALELWIGALLVVMCIATLNVVLLAFALAILLAPVLSRVRWQNMLLRPWLYLPFLALGCGLLLGALRMTSLWVNSATGTLLP